MAKDASGTDPTGWSFSDWAQTPAGQAAMAQGAAAAQQTYAQGQERGWSWSGALAAASSGAAAGGVVTAIGGWSAAIGAVVGAIVGEVLYWLGASDEEKAAAPPPPPPLAVFPDPGNPRLLWHHAGSRQLNALPLYLMAEQTPADGGTIHVQAVGGFREILEPDGQVVPSMCRVHLIPALPTEGKIIIETWMDACGIPEVSRPSYGGAWFALIETPDPTHGFARHTANPQVVIQDSRWAVGAGSVPAPDPRYPSHGPLDPPDPLAAEPLQMVIWAWHQFPVGGWTPPPRFVPANARLVAIQVPDGRPIGLPVPPVPVPGGGAAKSSGALWVAAPLVLGAAGLVIKALK